MALAEISVSGYRSIRELRLKLSRINVLTGPNGCGKSNLYNSLLLIARAAQGRFARAIAEEGRTRAARCSCSTRRSRGIDLAVRFAPARLAAEHRGRDGRVSA